MLSPLFIALAMYSKIPVPQVKWDEKNMKYAMCFFPLVGAIIGLAFVGIFRVCTILAFGDIAKGVMLTVVPVLITGGIHVDGFIDTADAVSSYAPREKRLEILKDPHVGAFGIIWTIVYFIIYFGFCSEINEKTVIIIAMGFIFSRILSGYGAISIPKARNDGLLVTFADGAKQNVVQTILIALGFVVAGIMAKINFLLGCLTVASALMVYYLYKKFAIKTFGGVTGDLAGFFLQLCEITILITTAVIEKMVV
ncbi:MAG: adenosylcobinamide-GDP ribazoletransferase [Lachnospiraceae bacterium]|nr:adenosylcobinamide-GDP ribazoletransferase [Lachnospiraceae bacterium]